jgi:hypothetical protein
VFDLGVHLLIIIEIIIVAKQKNYCKFGIFRMKGTFMYVSLNQKAIKFYYIKYAVNEGKSAASFCRQVAVLVPICFANFI